MHMQPRASLGDSACTRRVTRDTHHLPPIRDLAEYVERALFTIGFSGEEDNSWTACVDHTKGPLKKARSCSDAMVSDTVKAAAIYLKACMRDGTRRIKSAFASGTPRSTSFVGESLRALEIFDTFKGEMSTMAKLHKSFGNTMVAMKGSYSGDSGTLDATPPDWPDEVEDGYGDAADGDAADGDAADDEEEVTPTKKRRKKTMRGNKA